MIALALYVSTLAPGVLGGDAGELQFAPAILSLPHPSGYPVQVLLDRLWLALFPFGAVAWRINLLSALVSAGTVAVVTGTVTHSTSSHLAGIGAGLALAVAPVFWSQAVLGDKYALNGLLTALLLAAALHFHRHRGRSSWLWLALAAGFAVAHHRSLWLFAPLIAVWILLHGRRLLLRPANWLWGLLAFALPLLTYLYVPWAASRALPPGNGMQMDWAHFWRFVLSEGSAGQVRVGPDAAGLLLYLGRLTESYPLPWLILLGIALVFFLLRPQRRAWLLFLVAAFVVSAYLSAVYENYDLPRRYVYFVPSYVCLALLIGELLGRTIQLPRPSKLGKLPAVALLGLALIPLISLPARWSLLRAEQAHEQTLDIWRQTLKAGGRGDRMAAALSLVADNALIVADWEQATPLWYAQTVDGVCPACVIDFPLHELIDSAGRATDEGRPLYVARTVNAAATWSHPRAVGALVELGAAPQTTLPAGMTPLDLRFDNRLALAGYLLPLDRPAYAAGRVVPITLVWRRTGDDPLPDYAMSLRLEGPNGEVWKADNPAPVLGMHPFSAFDAGEVVTDYVEIPIAADAIPGEYVLWVVLYVMDEGGFRNAEVTGAERAEILRFRIE